MLLKQSKNLRINPRASSETFKSIKTVHCTKNQVDSSLLHDENYKIVILESTSEFVVATLTGELKVFDLETMMIKRVIYAFQGSVTHLSVKDNCLVGVGNEYNQRMGLGIRLKMYSVADKQLI